MILRLLLVVVVTGCSSSVMLTIQPAEKVLPENLKRKMSVRVGDVDGNGCFRKELTNYLSSPGGLQLAQTSDNADLILTGAVRRIEVHSNRGDKEVSLLYFSAFIITAPIAAAMYSAKDWHADAAAEGQLTARDTGGRLLWSKELTVSVAESQRTMPTAEALQTAMTAAVCQKLATTLLNGLAEHLAAGQ